MILLDTNVVSELMKAAPAASVLRWIAGSPAASFYTTSVTQAEIMHGIMLLPVGKRRNAFEAAAIAMFGSEFRGRVLPFGGDAAYAYARIAAARSRSGRPISQFDAQIAAIAHSSGAALATRNVKDFARCDVELIDPWDA